MTDRSHAQGDLAPAALGRHRPRFAPDAAAAVAREQFGVDGAASELPSERDQNFRIDTADGHAFVLKIAQAREDRGVLELQNLAMATVAAEAPDVSVPRVCRTKSGAAIAEVAGPDGRQHFVRLLTHLPGVPLAQVRPRSDRLLQDLGRMLGRLDRALAAVEHPAMNRALRWDLKHAARVIEDHRDAIADPEGRALVDRLLARFVRDAGPRLSCLRQSLVHHDANDHNVLVEDSVDGQRVCGLIDFGDMVSGYTLAEVAVAAAYAMLGARDPLGAAAHVLGGYHLAFPLPAAEIALLFDLIVMRLGTSVAIAAHQTRQEADAQYLAVSEAPAWELLRRVADVPPAWAHATFRAACGLEPSATHDRVVGWLRAGGAEFAPVLEHDLREVPVCVLDLGVASPDLAGLPPDPDVARLGALVDELRRAAGATVAIGRYGEARLLYRSELFAGEDNGPGAGRTIHLGVDLFGPAGAPVFAPLDGEVHGFAVNDAPLDYGPTIVLRHAPADGVEFFTLYGHLSGDSLARLSDGQRVQKGERIAALGAADENGGWPPHLHFQLILDPLGQRSDFPGVARPAERAVWQSLCPDPSVVLGLQEAALPVAGRPAAELRAARGRVLSDALGLSYRRPLHIVRGAGQFLYDADGRPYLDAVNNVAHVGHCHPRVVRAGQQQMAVLNTNTRYLHELLVRYAERLTASLPDPLEVCFFVCSGSEANELALRLARARSGGTDFVVIEGAYHGNTGGLIELSPYKFEGEGGCAQRAHVQQAAMPDPYRGPHRRDDPAAGEKYAADVAAATERIRAQGRRLAGFLAEPFLGCGGQVIPPPGYLRAAYAHVRAAGGVCIADEVQVGFGRAGTAFWAFETQQVVPDIVTLGKPIGNGHPLGAVVTTRAIATSFATGMEYFNTFGGNPVSCAIGLAVLDVIADEGMQHNARVVGERLLAGLSALAERHDLIGDVRGHGLFLGVELVRDRATRAPAAAEAAYVVERMKDEGILLSTDGPLHNVVKIKPPMVFTAADADRLVATLDRVLADSCLD